MVKSTLFNDLCYKKIKGKSIVKAILAGLIPIDANKRPKFPSCDNFQLLIPSDPETQPCRIH